MSLVSLIVVALALAMDAFAVAVASSVVLGELTPRRVFRLAFHFGLFQALMPTLGWLAGTAISDYIGAIDHWVAFMLLAVVGGRMVRGGLQQGDDERERTDPTRGWDLVILSVATSIDALAVGLSLAVLGNQIIVPAITIGVITAAVTATGMFLGQKVGEHWGPRVEIAGGLVLIVIGIRIVMQHGL
jgi:putative Mn2+ efflux pump MntP